MYFIQLYYYSVIAAVECKWKSNFLVRKALFAKYSLSQFVNYPTDTFHSEPSIVANAKFPTALFPSYRSVHAAISRMTCHPCLIRRTFLTCFSWVSYQWWSTAVNSTIRERRGELAMAALSSFHFPDSVPYNVCRRLLI